MLGRTIPAMLRYYNFTELVLLIIVDWKWGGEAVRTSLVRRMPDLWPCSCSSPPFRHRVSPFSHAYGIAESPHLLG